MRGSSAMPIAVDPRARAMAASASFSSGSGAVARMTAPTIQPRTITTAAPTAMRRMARHGSGECLSTIARDLDEVLNG